MEIVTAATSSKQLRWGDVKQSRKEWKILLIYLLVRYAGELRLGCIAQKKSGHNRWPLWRQPPEMKRVHLCSRLGGGRGVQGKMNRHNKLSVAVSGVAPQKKKNVCLKKKNVVNILKHTKNIFHLLLARFVSDSATANCERERKEKNSLAAWRFVVVARAIFSYESTARADFLIFMMFEKAVWWESSNGYDGIPLLWRDFAFYDPNNLLRLDDKVNHPWTSDITEKFVKEEIKKNKKKWITDKKYQNIAKQKYCTELNQGFPIKARVDVNKSEFNYF